MKNNKENWDSIAESYKSESTGLWQSENIAIKEYFIDKSEPILIIGGGDWKSGFYVG